MLDFHNNRKKDIRMAKGIVFDMDGVIFDTENLAVRTWTQAFTHFGIDLSEDLAKTTVGMSFEDTCQYFIQHIHTPFDIEPIIKQRFDYTEQFIETNGVPLKAGVFELLDFLKAKDYKIAVATSTVSQTARPYLDNAGLTRYFHTILCGDNIQRRKPEPDIYLMACDHLNLAPADCIALEDSPTGVQAAYRAGLKVIMVPDILQPDKHVKNMLFAEIPNLHYVIDLLQTTE